MDLVIGRQRHFSVNIGILPAYSTIMHVNLYWQLLIAGSRSMSRFICVYIDNYMTLKVRTWYFLCQIVCYSSVYKYERASVMRIIAVSQQGGRLTHKPMHGRRQLQHSQSHRSIASPLSARAASWLHARLPCRGIYGFPSTRVRALRRFLCR